jgi:adenylosuccinate synthase
MPINIVVGAQWGDEGKGRITDLLAAHADIVARYSGGDNAGHTVTIGEEIFKLHLIPSGIIHDGVICLIGNGAVVNPAVLLREMDSLARRGVDVGPQHLKLSRKAHLITPAHIALDRASEVQRGKVAIGTTQRGIGPAYADKSNRIGIRACHLADEEKLADLILAHIKTHNRVLTKIHGLEPIDAVAVAAEYREYAQRLALHLADADLIVDEALSANLTILAEGAQGTLLDIDHGTYPFVTSSSPTAGGALCGLGVGPKHVNRIIGVAKAFTTRVGRGPFPTELEGDLALRLRGTGENPWDEYGTTTGRPRRVGWLDLVILYHARRTNSLTDLVVTKLDILSGIEEIPVCIAYDLDGERISHIPADLETLARCRPIYDNLPGWNQDIMGVRHLADLPRNAQNYLTTIAERTGIPISHVSVGPGRGQSIVVK